MKNEEKRKIFCGTVNTNPGECKFELGVFLAVEHEDYYELDIPVYVGPHVSTQFLEKKAMGKFIKTRDNVTLCYSESEGKLVNWLLHSRSEYRKRLAKYLEEVEATVVETKHY